MKAKAQKVGSNRGALQAAALAVAVALAAGYSSQAAAQNKGGGGSTGSAAGVITIDQARAEAGGVTPGDALGFPVTISRPGSYRLMSNLTVTDPNVTAIEIIGNDVTLDLNGFSINGPVVCAFNFPVSCSPVTGTGDGIAVTGSNAWGNVVIMNGTVRGMGRHGIHFLDSSKRGALIDRVRTVANRANGMRVMAGVVSNSVSMSNGEDGIAGNFINLQSSFVGTNGRYGLNSTVYSGYGANVFVGNGLANVSDGPRQIGVNLCSGFICQ